VVTRSGHTTLKRLQRALVSAEGFALRASMQVSADPARAPAASIDDPGHRRGRLLGGHSVAENL